MRLYISMAAVPDGVPEGVAEEHMEMTQNQVYGVPAIEQETAVDISMETNVGYGVS